MEYQLKSLSSEAIPEALQKAERYRLIEEPWQAESICLDILQIDPNNQQALVTLLLSLTDQFGAEATAARARDVIAKLEGEYEKAYYAGIICERLARVRMSHGLQGASFKAYEGFVSAMNWYEKAEVLRPAGNDDSILRWNTCARTLMRHPELRPQPEDRLEPVLDD